MHPQHRGLYKDAYERDSCGFGLIASLDDEPSHWLVQTAMASLNRLTHRGAIAADGKTGDGCGLLLKKPEKFLRAVAAEAGHRAAPRLRLRPGVPVTRAGAARRPPARSWPRSCQRAGAGARRLARACRSSPKPAARRR